MTRAARARIDGLCRETTYTWQIASGISASDDEDANSRAGHKTGSHGKPRIADRSNEPSDTRQPAEEERRPDAAVAARNYNLALGLCVVQ